MLCTLTKNILCTGVKCLIAAIGVYIYTTCLQRSKTTDTKCIYNDCVVHLAVWILCHILTMFMCLLYTYRTCDVNIPIDRRMKEAITVTETSKPTVNLNGIRPLSTVQVVIWIVAILSLGVYYIWTASKVPLCHWSLYVPIIYIGILIVISLLESCSKIMRFSRMYKHVTALQLETTEPKQFTNTANHKQQPCDRQPLLLDTHEDTIADDTITVKGDNVQQVTRNSTPTQALQSYEYEIY